MRNVVEISDIQLLQLMKAKATGWSKAKISNASGYLVSPVSQFTIHDLARKHRSMNEMEYTSLVQSISEVGQTDPVLVYRGKIVDGRHRYYALKDLGIDYIKYIELPHKAALEDIKEMISGSEARRTDTPAQKTARAYLDWFDDGMTETLHSYSTKVGVSGGSLRKIKIVADNLGIKIIRDLYSKSEVWIENKKYTSINILYNYARAINHDKPEIQNDNFTPSKYNMSDIVAAATNGDLVLLSSFKTWLTNQINKINND